MRCCSWKVRQAFSLVFLAEDRIIVARDPRGFRPLAMGKLEISGGKPAYVFASETCAFDLINAVYLGDVQPGEMVIVRALKASAMSSTRQKSRARSVCLNMSIFHGPIPSFLAARCRIRAI